MPKIIKNPLVLPIVGEQTGNEVPQNHLGIKATDDGLKIVDSNGTAKIALTVDGIFSKENLDIAQLEDGKTYLIL